MRTTRDPEPPGGESGGRLRDFGSRGIPILCFHDVSDTKNAAFGPYILAVKRFTRLMALLRRWRYRPITLDQLLDHLEHGGPLPRRPVVITFDDGYKDLKATATPLLARLGFAHTHFVNTGRLGGTTQWVAEAPDIPILDRRDLQQMIADHGDWVDFQAHGQTHRSFAGLDRLTLEREVLDCQASLETIVGRPVRYVAYPYGEYDDAVTETLASLAVRGSFTVDQGLCRRGQNPHRLPRVEIFAGDTTLDFALKLRFGWSPISSLGTLPLPRILKRLYRRLTGRVTPLTP